MILSTEGVTKRFGTLSALEDVSLGVEDGITKAVIGPNGAGKSTLFNVLSGVYRPTDGTITFKGEDVTDLSSSTIARKGLVKSYQIANIFPEATVFENIRIAAQVNETTYDMLSKAESYDDVNDRAEAVLDRIRMRELRDEEADVLSHGDQRKLEIGIVLATDPDLILFDEPTAGMSQDETNATIDLVESLAEEGDLTIVITEHDIDLIMNLADEITVLHQGKVLEEGTPEEITRNPQVQEVYLGE